MRLQPAADPEATLVAMIDGNATRDPDAHMLVDPQDRRLTWAELRVASLRVAERLRGQGVTAGDRVATVAENSLELFALIVATWRLGAVVVPLNPSQTEQWLAGTVDLADPALVFGDSRVVVPGRDVLPLPALDTRPLEREVVQSPTTAKTPALIMFSSGTTGRSKGCVLSHGYLAFFGREFAVMAELTTADRVMCVTALYHVNAFWAFAGSVVNGTTHIFEQRFSASRFWGRATVAGATVFDYVGAIVAILLRAEGERPAGCALRVCLGGGVRERELREFEARFGCTVLEGYGLTECAQPIYQVAAERRLGSIGRPSRHFAARVVDSEGDDVSSGSPGELWLRPRGANTMFDGYWRNDRATAEAFEDGWFRTRDLVRRDAEGYYYYIERMGDVIRRRGENISAFDLEGVFAAHPAVRLVAAIAVPSDLTDDDILLAVELVEGAELSPSALLEWARPRIADFMVPRYVRFGRLPCTASERIERYKLKQVGVTAETYDVNREEAAI